MKRWTPIGFGWPGNMRTSRVLIVAVGLAVSVGVLFTDEVVAQGNRPTPGDEVRMAMEVWRGGVHWGDLKQLDREGQEGLLSRFKRFASFDQETIRAIELQITSDYRKHNFTFANMKDADELLAFNKYYFDVEPTPPLIVKADGEIVFDRTYRPTDGARLDPVEVFDWLRRKAGVRKRIGYWSVPSKQSPLKR